MHEFLAIVATFIFGLSVTAIVAVGLEHRQLAGVAVDENADVRAGIIKLTASGYAIAPALTRRPSSLGSRRVGCAPTCDDKGNDGPFSSGLSLFIQTRERPAQNEKGRPERSGRPHLSSFDCNLSA